MFALTPTLHHYAWGTPDDIPALLGTEPTGEPVAELWLGAHASAPSECDVDGRTVLLDALVRSEPEAMLGVDSCERFGPELPFLLKILAISKPLSIQVHPSRSDAQARFAAQGSDGPRPFADANHKPEMIVALTPMVVLSGFRGVAETAADLRLLGGAQADACADLIETADTPGAAIDAYLHHVLSDADVSDVIARLASAQAEDGSVRIASHALRHFPGDRGALVALAMNVVQLQPGEACFIDDGIVHSYQSGVGVEIMANSDNVIRAGLTPKPLNVHTLMEIACTEPTAPEIVKGEGTDGVVEYECGAEEFGLTMFANGASTVIAAGPRIVLALSGSVTVRTIDGVAVTLNQGEALFVPHSEGDTTLEARGSVAVAHLPASAFPQPTPAA